MAARTLRKKNNNNKVVPFSTLFFMFTLTWITEKELERVVENKRDEFCGKKNMKTRSGCETMRNASGQNLFSALIYWQISAVVCPTWFLLILFKLWWLNITYVLSKFVVFLKFTPFSGSYYFGGAPSKGFATLRNVPKLIFLGQDWARKVCRFSVLFGYLTKWEPN